MNKTTFWIVVALLLVILLTHIFSHRGQKDVSVITIAGTGTIFAQPDMAQLSISLYKVARTTKLAQEEVSKMTRKVLAILKDANIEDKNINTASLNFRAEWDYKNYGRVFLGQRAEQRLTISVEGIREDTERLSRIIDDLIEIDGIELENMTFNIKDNSEYFAKTRELAFTKAKDKAEQYAKLSGMKVVKISHLSEEGVQNFGMYSSYMGGYGAMNRQMFEYSKNEAVASADMSALPTGDMEITTRVIVEFILK